MGHLTGYTYRHIANSLKRLHARKFDRQAAMVRMKYGSMRKNKSTRPRCATPEKFRKKQ